MSAKCNEFALFKRPWGAIVGELVTAGCFGCICLFVPMIDWIRWPDLLFALHIAVVAIGSLALSVMLFQRRHAALKPAIAFAAYIGLPHPGSIVLAVDFPAPTFNYFLVSGVGTLAQGVVVWSCLSRLTTKPSINPDEMRTDEPDELSKLIDERIAAHAADPTGGVSWEQAKAIVRESLRR